ncbi:MAG: ABC transporter substrate-binding protein [Pseudomonadota bacterium]
MKTLLKTLTALVVTAPLTAPLAGEAQTEITVLHSHGWLFEQLQKDLAAKFMEENPEITVTVLPPVKKYEEAAQAVLRGAITGDMPDVSFQGINRVRLMVERDIAQPMTPFIEAEADFDSLGYNSGLITAGQWQGTQYGIPFAVSTPIMYYNADLVKQAGGDPDNMPTEWNEVIALANAIDGLGDDIQGIQYNWMITGNWMFQALVFSNGGTMLDASEASVAFDEQPGIDAMNTLGRIVTEGKMPVLARSDARAKFGAGQIGLYFSSTSAIGTVKKLVEDKFDFRTAAFPKGTSAEGRLPSGGNVAMIHSTDDEKRAAAWEYAKFVTGELGQQMMTRATGYMPSNDLAVKALADFYEESPQHAASLAQLPIMTGWYAFPGDNALKITDVIYGQLEAVVTRTAEPQEALEAMTSEVEALLPRS